MTSNKTLDDLLQNEKISKFLNHYFNTNIDSISNSSKKLQPKLNDNPGDATLKKLFEDKWILTVVSLRFRSKETKQFYKKIRSSYRRTFILLNLVTGEIIPCIINNAKVKKQCKKYISQLSSGNIIKTIEKGKDYSIIGSDDDIYYYNIYHEKLDENATSTPKKKKEYLSRSKLLNIQLERLVTELNSKTQDVKEKLLKELRNDYYKTMILPQDSNNKI